MMLLAAATAPPPARATIAPGLWEIRNVPKTATLDGRALADLPLGAIRSERVCLNAAAAASPAAWFARDTADLCRLTQAAVAGGRVTIRGACPTDIAGKEGALVLDGRYDAGSFAVDFATTTPQPEGVMRFSGTMHGRRLGTCPAGAGETDR